MAFVSRNTTTERVAALTRLQHLVLTVGLPTAVQHLQTKGKHLQAVADGNNPPGVATEIIELWNGKLEILATEVVTAPVSGINMEVLVLNALDVIRRNMSALAAIEVPHTRVIAEALEDLRTDPNIHRFLAMVNLK